MRQSRTGFDKTKQHKTQQIHCPETAGLLTFRRQSGAGTIVRFRGGVRLGTNVMAFLG